jgi:hypothetical protein
MPSLAALGEIINFAAHFTRERSGLAEVWDRKAKLLRQSSLSAMVFANVPRTLASELETVCFTEENALSARKYDLFPVF